MIKEILKLFWRYFKVFFILSVIPVWKYDPIELEQWIERKLKC